MSPTAEPHIGDARFRALTEALPALVFVADTAGRTIFVNRWAETYFSSPRDALLGDVWLRHVHPEDRSDALEQLGHALAQSGSYNVELRFRRSDGEYRMHACRAEPTRAESGEVLEWLGVCIDVEEHRRAERALRERAADLQTLLDTLPVGVFIAHDPQCKRISGNRAAAELLRLPPDANLSKSAGDGEVPMNFRILKHGHEIPVDQLPVQRAARGEIVRSEEVDHEFSDGTPIHTLISARPLLDAEGRTRGAVAAILDITGLKSAEASDRRKAEFLAELGHELRNPLAPLTAAVDLLRRPGLDEARTSALAATMQRQLGYLVSLVDELLDVARIGRGEVELERKVVDLRSVVDAAVEIARPLVTERRHELTVLHAGTALPVDGDARRLTQVAVNLLTNASKYMHPGGTVRVSTERDDDSVLLRVQDTGLGIPSDQLDEIFRMFARVPAQRERTGGAGLGIGLALARRMVALHGGSIEARSEGLGRGSEFVVRLKAAPPAVASSEPIGLDTSRGATTPRRVLVVDDNVDAADTLRMWIELEGHEVRVAHDGPAALEALRSFPAEIALLDIGLPLMDGYELARRIRVERGRGIALIALTGWGQADDRRRSRDAGFDEHLTKPIDGQRLRALLAAPLAH